MAIVFKNNAKTTLAGNVTTSATSITVSDGSVFPAISGGDTFFCTFDDGTNNEIVSVTAISGNVLTVVRAQDNTTAKAFTSGDAAESRLTAGILDTFSQVDSGEVTADEFIGDLRGAVIFKAQASEAVSKGDAVYVSGISGNTPVVSLADADLASKMPAFGLVLTAASANGSTEVVTFGTISGIDTSAFSVGDTLYISTTAGELTNSKPTGESSLIQNIGKVQKSHASSGSIKVGGAGRTNDVPNLNDGNIFIGNASNQATTSTLDTSIVPENTNLYYTDARVEAVSINNVVEDTTPQLGGDLASNGNDILFGDNDKAIFGAGSDLQIYHDGSNSYIQDSGTGNLELRGTNFKIGSSTGSVQFIETSSTGLWTRLKYNSSVKLQTVNTGIDVTGTATMDGLTVSATTATVNITGGNTGASLINFGDAADGNVGRIYYDHTADFMQFKAADGERLRINSTGIDVTGTIDASGDITTTGNYIADTHFRSSDSNATLSATGGGGVYLRPDGNSNSANQVFIASGTGNATFSGTLEATSFSDGTISGITFIDEDSFATNSATRVPTQQSIKAYVDAEVAGVVDTAPAALDTLNELAAALGDDANFSTTTSTSLGNRLRVDTAAQGLTGTQQANAITNLGITATKAELNFVDGVTSSIQTQLNGKQATGSYLTGNQTITLSGDVSGSGTTSINVTVANDSHNHTKLFENATITFGASQFQWMDQNGTGGTGLNGAAPRNPANGWYHNLIMNHANGAGYYSQLSFGLNTDDAYFSRVAGGTAQSFQRIFADNYHPNADTLTTARTINGVSFNGSANITIADSTKLPLAGGTMTGALNVSATTNARDIKISAGYHLQRSDHHSGHLEGSYNNVAANGSKTNPIYTIGSNYNPASTTLSSMYGIGYCHANQAGFVSLHGTSGWGMYVASGGSASIFLDGQGGTIHSASQHYVGSSVVWNAGNDGSGSGLDADLLDGLQTASGPTANTIPTRTANGDIAAREIILSSALITATPTVLVSMYPGTNQLVRTTPAAVALGMSAWTSSNDGSGSGLDADLLDGAHGSSFLRSDAADSSSQRISFQANNTNSWDTIATSSGSQGCIEIFNNGVGTDAFMTFHVGSDFACYFGLDGGTNKLSVGGWSMGAYSYEIYHAGNKPSLAALGYTGATNANYITNNNQLTNGAGYTSIDTRAYNSTNSYIGGYYVNGGTGQKPNNSKMNAGKLTFSMQNSSNLGFGGTWNDVLWMSSYTGSDVKKSVAIVSSKYDNTSLWVAKQNYDSTSWGTGYLLWNSGNDGSGSGLDADLLDGLELHTGRNNVANRVVRTDGNGYIQAGWINTTSGTSSSAVARVYCSQDGYIRYLSPSSFISNLGLFTTSNDGSGSGLDADLLDGIQGANLLRSDVVDVLCTSKNSGTLLSRNGFTDAIGYNPSYGTYIGGGASNAGHYVYAGGYISKNGVHTLWHSGNDGSGSGLDADTVDSIQASQIVSGGSNRKSVGVSAFAGVNEVSGFYYGNNITGAPTTDWVNYIHSAGNSWASSNNYSFQLTHAFHSDNLWVSRTTNGGQSTARKVWDSASDGSGSGLDADLLDGVQGASYLRSDTGDTINNGIVIQQRGRFSTGTSGQNTNAGSFAYDWGYQESGAWSSPFPDLVIGYHTGMQLGGHKNYNGTRFFNDHPKHGSPTMIFSVGNGDDHIRATSNIYAYTSDKRLKENFRTIENAVDKVKSLGGYIFDWREDMMTKYEFEPDQKKDDAGVIAQDVLKVMPAAVQRAPFDYDPHKKGHSKSGEEFMTVQYEKMVPLLIQAIKEQQEQIDELKEKLENK